MRLILSLLLMFPIVAQTQEYDEFSSVPASPKSAWAADPVPAAEENPWWIEGLLWLPNRFLDFIDIFRFDIGVGPSIGGVVRVSKYAQVGIRSMVPVSVRVGAFGRRIPVMAEGSNEFGISPVFNESADREICPGEVGAGADLLLVGIYSGVCVDEIADFALGLFFIDFKEDDLH